MQGVTELVKESGHLVVRQERWRAAERSGEIAHQLRYRDGFARGERFGDDTLVHPGPAALLDAGIRIEIEARDDASFRVGQVVVAHARVPDADAGPLPDGDAVETLGHPEKPGEHFGKRKIRPQCLLRDLEPALLEPLAEVRQIPGFEL